MSIDLSRVTGISDSRGVITEIKDSLGRVIWSAGGKPVVLTVEKKSFTSYAGETSHSSECVLLDVYPKKSNSTVKVTYGGLTKTLTFSGTNAQQVFFGSYNGEVDSVATPASGTLTIEGGCGAFAQGVYQSLSKETAKSYTTCISSVADWGSVERIPDYAFYGVQGVVKIALNELPKGITSIGASAFKHCDKITVREIPHGVKTIGAEAFWMSTTVDYKINASMTEITLPSTIESIGDKAFACDCYGGTQCYLSNVTILATTPPILGEFVFGSKDKKLIHVPKGCGDIYRAAEGWSAHAIEEAT